MARALLGFPVLWIEVAALWHLPWDWRVVVMLLCGVVAFFGAMGIGSTSHATALITEALRDQRQSQRCVYTPISTKEYVASVERAKSARCSGAKTTLPWWPPLVSHRLRLVAAEGRYDDRLAGLATSVAYGAPFEGWVVLPWHPKEMSGPQHFVALHEIGHTSIGGTAFEGRDMHIRGTYVFLLYAALKVQATAPLLAALMFLTMAWVVLSRIQSRYNRRVARLHDEIYADEYALTRCNPAWLGDGPTVQIANTLCQNQNDRRVGSEETRIRIAAFAENLELVRAGKPTRPALDYLPKRSWGARALPLLEDVLLATLLISCGLLHGSLTDLRLELLVGASFLAGCAAMAIGAVIQSFVSLLDHRFGIKGEDTYSWKYAEALIEILRKLKIV